MNSVRALAHDGCGSGFDGFVDIVVAIDYGAGLRHKQRTGLDLPGIELNILYVDIRFALDLLYCEVFQ